MDSRVKPSEKQSSPPRCIQHPGHEPLTRSSRFLSVVDQCHPLQKDPDAAETGSKKATASNMRNEITLDSVITLTFSQGVSCQGSGFLLCSLGSARRESPLTKDLGTHNRSTVAAPLPWPIALDLEPRVFVISVLSLVDLFDNIKLMYSLISGKLALSCPVTRGAQYNLSTSGLLGLNSPPSDNHKEHTEQHSKPLPAAIAIMFLRDEPS